MSADFDLAIVGSGFAGTRLAMIARRLGLSVLMIERGRHPRFAIGESSTPLANLWLGLGKGVVFGLLIALVACHFGLRIEANTESLGQGTTSSVVTAITIVIIVDAVFAVMFSSVGVF